MPQRPDETPGLFIPFGPSLRTLQLAYRSHYVYKNRLAIPYAPLVRLDAPRPQPPGDRENARELLTEAIAMYRQIGMPKHVGMAEALLREMQRPQTRRLGVQAAFPPFPTPNWD